MAGMFEHEIEEPNHVLVSQSVELVPVFSPPNDESLSRQQLEAVRGGRNRLVEVLGESRHASFPFAQTLEKSKALRATRSFEHRRRATE